MKQNETTDFHYICNHLGEDERQPDPRPVAPPIYMTSLHTFETLDDMFYFDKHGPEGQYTYGRVSNPTTRLLEKKLAAMDSAEDALCFSCGMAAISSAILACVQPGDHVISVKNVYGPARSFMETELPLYQVETTFVSGNDTQELLDAVRPNTRMIYLESPTSLVFELQDIRAITRYAKANNIVTMIDNTWATPIYQRPILLGVDVVLYSMTKYIGGHSDVLGGAVCSNKEIITRIYSRGRLLYGGIIGPFEAWLAMRGLRTMPLRLEHSSRSARAVTEFLEKHPKIESIRYPGSQSHPQHPLHAAQADGSSGLFGFVPKAETSKVKAFVNALRMFQIGVSWGGFESLAIMPFHNTADETIADRDGDRRMVRMYCGLESTDSLLEDLEHALKLL